LTSVRFVDILFKERKFEKQCNQQSALVRAQGGRRAQLIRARLDALHAAECLEDLRNVPGRLHELKGNRKGQLSLDLDFPYRLIFIPDHKPVPSTPDGGMDWRRGAAGKIRGVGDTHE
jgi:plasmid maintenance system killer protein